MVQVVWRLFDEQKSTAIGMVKINVIKHGTCTLSPIIVEVEHGALEDEFSLKKGNFTFP